jgi:ABC-type Fe3+/spermidine/putrescine transport system ATPase subunit
MLELRAISKRFPPGKQVLVAVDLAVADGSIFALLGPSGCGKTTLLRIVAGLEQPDAGRVWFDGEDVTATPVHQRRFGLMFQDYALFPHMTVAENVAFGLQMARLPRPAVAARVDQMLALVDLHGYGDRSVDRLSGGEQQRVALARTLAPQPRLLLLDEPLANLDRQLREELVGDLRTILSRVGVTTLVVTHDQQEAFVLADRLAVMSAGRLVQQGAPAAVYANPADLFVASFLGFQNLLPAYVVGDTVRTALGAWQLPTVTAAWAGKRVDLHLLIPQDAAYLAAPPASSDALIIAGGVQSVAFRGNFYRLAIAAPGATRLIFDLPAADLGAAPQIGDTLRLHLRAEMLRLIQGVA